jgi:hypothetical protein
VWNICNIQINTLITYVWKTGKTRHACNMRVQSLQYCNILIYFCNIRMKHLEAIWLGANARAAVAAPPKVRRRKLPPNLWRKINCKTCGGHSYQPNDQRISWLPSVVAWRALAGSQSAPWNILSH